MLLNQIDDAFGHTASLVIDQDALLAVQLSNHHY